MITYETVIGLEIHVQINTKSKAFCADLNKFGHEANTNISATSLAHPGTLPINNELHLEKAIRMGLAIGSSINPITFFDRKHYVYPDSPSAYQITQDQLPYCKGGLIKYHSEGKEKQVRIHHIHMEGDAGKLMHDMDKKFSYIDYNRAGVPLLEIVTEPDLRSGQEVYDFCATVQKLVQFLGISDGNMEEGSIRFDCNVSVNPVGQRELGERCEIKNLNSKKFAKNAVIYEAKRQIKILTEGGEINRSTLLYNSDKNITIKMRDKEDANDYRYFPDPDLSPMTITDEYIQELRKTQRETPKDFLCYFEKECKLSKYNASQLILTYDIANSYKNFSQVYNHHEQLAKFYINCLIPYSQQKKGDLNNNEQMIEKYISLLEMIRAKEIDVSKAYNTVYPKINTSTKSVRNLATKLGVLIIADKYFITNLVKTVISNNPEKLKAYQKGKKGLIGFFMGEAMKLSGGKAKAEELRNIFEKELNL